MTCRDSSDTRAEAATPPALRLLQLLEIHLHHAARHGRRDLASRRILDRQHLDAELDVAAHQRMQETHGHDLALLGHDLEADRLAARTLRLEDAPDGELL